MTDELASQQRESRRRLQFSLRKVLLWTAVVAVCIGIAIFAWDEVLPYYGVPSMASLALTAIVAVTLRTWIHSGIAWPLTTLVGGLIYAIYGRGWSSWPYLRYSLDVEPQQWVACYVSEHVIMGFGWAWVVFLLVEGTCRTIDRLDRIGQSDG